MKTPLLQSHMSTIFHACTDSLFKCILWFIVEWPEGQQLKRQTELAAFRVAFKVHINRQCRLPVQAMTCWNNKHHNTVADLRNSSTFN